MFSIRLKELREKAGISQAQLAMKLGVRQSTVGMWENGKNKPQNAKLEMLANMFDVSTDYLLGRTDEPQAQVETASSVPDPTDILAQKRYALNKKTYGFNENQLQDLLDMAEIIARRQNS